MVWMPNTIIIIVHSVGIQYRVQVQRVGVHTIAVRMQYLLQVLAVSVGAREIRAQLVALLLERQRSVQYNTAENTCTRVILVR